MSVLQSRPVVPHTQTSCPNCKAQLEYPTQATANSYEVECFSCKKPFKPSTTNDNPPPRKARGRKIGTQESPLETKYYDILGVPVDATPDDIKKAYRRLAIKLHPDKNRDDPNADEKFKEIAIAYQTLSDPVLRKKYNEFGPKESAPEGGYVDPEEIFGTIFGGEKFLPIFGQISLAKDMKTALQEEDEPEIGPSGQKKILSVEEKAKKVQKEQALLAQKAKEREERVAELVKNLERKLSIFAESAIGPNDPDVTQSWRTICKIEADELRNESFGVDLLHTIGFVYSSKAKQSLATSQTFFGVGGWLHGVQNKYHVFSETVGTVRAALEVKRVFEQLAEAEKAGATPEQRKKLEEQAAEKGMQALFKGAKLEIESVLRETCDRVLNPETPLPPHKLILRATALEILGDVYSSVQKDSSSLLESDYVRVETKQSKARDSGTFSPFAR